MVPVIEVKGASIPAIGLGTMTLKGDVCVDAVSAALTMGYRHIDTAAFYGNEAEVGEGLRKSGVGRDEIFLTTKVRNSDLAAGDVRGVRRGQPRKAWPTLCRPAPDPLAEPGIAAVGLHSAALRGEAQRAGEAYRRRQFHRRAARGGGEDRRRAAGEQPDRGASVP